MTAQEFVDRINNNIFFKLSSTRIGGIYPYKSEEYKIEPDDFYVMGKDYYHFADCEVIVTGVSRIIPGAAKCTEDIYVSCEAILNKY